MPKKVTQKKKQGSKAVKKNKNMSTVMLGVSFALVMVLLVAAMIIINYKPSGVQLADQTEAVRQDTVDEITSPEQVDDDDSIDNAITHSAELLGVKPSLITKRIRDGVIHYHVQLDRNRIDLTLGNMIMTGNIENAGGVIIKGEEIARGTVHVLTVRNEKAGKDYNVRLSYARSGAYQEMSPKIAVIVDDFGEFGGALLEEFLRVDINVTFAILPHLKYSRKVMDRAVASGREVMLHIPMEPLDYPRNNPGINPVLVQHSNRDISRIMEGYLRSVPLVSGANNHMGSLATTDERVMKAVLSFLQEKEMYFVDSRTTSLSVAYDMAQRMMLPSARRDIFLDVPDSSEETFNNKIRELRTLRQSGRDVVVITHCFDSERLIMLHRFIDEAKKMGYEIVPVSKLFITDVPEIL